MRQISDTTLDAQLDQRMRRVRLHQLFMRKLGPNDVVYLSAFATNAKGKVIEVKATALTFGEAFDQLWRNLDAVTLPEGK